MATFISSLIDKRSIRKLFAASIIIPILSCVSTPVNDGPLPIGADIPKSELKLKDFSGKEVTLKGAIKENGLLVMFSCNTCPVVIKNQERTKEILQYSMQKNIGVIILNSNEGNRSDEDSPEAMKQYAKEQGYSWHYAVDKNNELADAFGATRTPECFLFNKNGKLVYHGAIDDNPQSPENVSRHHLKEAINETVGGKEVSTKKTRSVGCSIKRLS